MPGNSGQGAESGNNQPLDGWKEIASWFGRDVRTVSRWEQKRGLPIHRLPGGGRGSVFAYPAELEAWKNRQADLLANGHTPAAHQWRWAGLAVGLALIAALGLSLTRATTIHTVVAGPQELRAVDASGKAIWTHAFSNRLHAFSQEKLARRLRLQDLDGDSQPEVLFAAAYHTGGIPSREELLCFDSAGRLRWRYQPNLRLAYRGRTFDTNWGFLDLEAGAGGIWAALIEAPWWGGALVRLDAAGRPELRFVSSGMIYRLAVMDSGLILAGGVNNEYAAPFFAVVGQDDPPVSSPQTPGSRHECLECPDSRPRRFFVLPNSELAKPYGMPYSNMELIHVRPNEVLVETGHGDFSQFLFRFSLDFQPLEVMPSASFRLRHDEYQRAGKLDHGYETCPQLAKPALLREWTPSGWREMQVPWRLPVRP